MSQMEDFYHEAHRIPVRMKPDEQVLADWLAVQQTKIASGALPVDRTYRLMVLIDDDPSVMLQPNGREFDTWLQSLRSSYASRGITSMIYPSDAGALLWEWRETMNLFYRRGELSAEQVEALDSVDTAWKERHRG